MKQIDEVCKHGAELRLGKLWSLWAVSVSLCPRRAPACPPASRWSPSSALWAGGGGRGQVLIINLGTAEIAASPMNKATPAIVLGAAMLAAASQGSRKTRTLALLHAEFTNDVGCFFAVSFISQRRCASYRSSAATRIKQVHVWPGESGLASKRSFPSLHQKRVFLELYETHGLVQETLAKAECWLIAKHLNLYMVTR